MLAERNLVGVSIDDLNLSIDEMKAYPRWYTDLLLRKGKQSVVIGDTLSFMDNFGLKESDKSKILEVFGDVLVSLDPAQFYVFIRLASHILQGQDLTPALAYVQAPVPKPRSILSRKRKNDYQSPNPTGSSFNGNPFRRVPEPKPRKLIDIDSFTTLLKTGTIPEDDDDQPPPTSRRKKRVTFNSGPPEIAEAAARSMEELLRQRGEQQLQQQQEQQQIRPPPSTYYPDAAQPPPASVEEEEDVEIDNTFKNVNIDSVLYHGASNLTPPQAFHFTDYSPSPSPPIPPPPPPRRVSANEPPLVRDRPNYNALSGYGATFSTGSASSLSSVGSPLSSPLPGSPFQSAPPSISSTPIQNTHARPVPPPLRHSVSDLPMLPPPPPQRRVSSNTNGLISNMNINSLTNGNGSSSSYTYAPTTNYGTTPLDGSGTTSYGANSPNGVVNHGAGAYLVPPPPPPSRRRAPSLPPQTLQYNPTGTPPTGQNGFLHPVRNPLGQQPTGHISSAPDLLADLKNLQEEVDRLSQR
jgi:hypothetical protein